MNIPEDILTPAERAELRLRKLYSDRGYHRYRMARFEPYDFYAAHRSFIGGRILTFADTDGRLMALKPDVTLSIIKNYRGGEERLSYTEKVYRDTGSSGEFREISETGIERIGKIGADDELEVIGLAKQSLEIISAEHILDVAHVGYISGLLAATEAGAREKLTELLRAKNAPGIRALGLEGEAAKVWETLAGMYGPVEDNAEQLINMALNAEMKKAAEELILAGTGANVDFSIISDMNYYNGLVFKGFVPGSATAVISGGRYDKLVKALGRRGGAIGFAVYLDSINGETV
ncbi:MAG: ATP phosphoribosyltransferase regulatory subunit [Oscillospiraceae bacterium]|nr:ATP phosphoribosyltransferase regulatory subunit [Oscillospiraceae bacterium]